MRILIFNWRDIKNPEAGGAEVHLQEIFKRIAKKGHEIVLVSSKFNGCEGFEVIDGIKIIRIGNKFNFNFAAIFYYLTKLRKEHFDVVVDDISKIPLCTPLYIKKPLIAIVLHIHGRTLFRELPFFMASYVWLSEKILIPFYKTKKIISISESTKKELVEMGISAKSVAVIHSGIMNHENMSYTKSKDPLVVYVGRIKAYKQLDHLIKAFKIAKGKVENSKLIIAGKGDKTLLRKLAFESGLNSSVEFYNEVSEDEKLKLLHEAWVFVIPSMKEGWGITVIEANACGTPAIAYDVPGLRDSIRDGFNGILVKDGDIEALSNCIIKILKDDILRRELSKNSLQWAKRFDWDRSAEQFLELIQYK